MEYFFYSKDGNQCFWAPNYNGSIFVTSRTPMNLIDKEKPNEYQGLTERNSSGGDTFWFKEPKVKIDQ